MNYFCPIDLTIKLPCVKQTLDTLSLVSFHAHDEQQKDPGYTFPRFRR